MTELLLPDDQRHTTDRQAFRFSVKEGTRGPWIAAEPLADHISALEGAILGFDLQPGFSMDEAAALADILNRSVSHVTLTPARAYNGLSAPLVADNDA